MVSLLIPIYTRQLVGEQSKYLDQGKHLLGKLDFSFSSWKPMVTQILIVILRLICWVFFFFFLIFFLFFLFFFLSFFPLKIINAFVINSRDISAQ